MSRDPLDGPPPPRRALGPALEACVDALLADLDPGGATARPAVARAARAWGTARLVWRRGETP